MESKFSRGLVITTIEFLRAAREELGAELGEEKANAMIDAFDPALKAQVFFELLMGNIGYVKIQREQGNVSTQKKIYAIKAVRRISGLGLKEAKDIVDGCYDKAVSIEGSFSAEQQRKFRDNLKDTGYIVK